MGTNEPILRFELRADTPAYRQIVDALRQKLVAGEIKAGDLLPPVRQLAYDLGLHFNTVAEAYRILQQEGWLDLRRRRGALVLERKMPSRPEPGWPEQFSSRVRELVAELRAAGVNPAKIARELRGLAEGLEQ